MGELGIRNRRHRQGEIAYIVHPRAWGRGVGTAIGRELLSRGFGELGLHRIYASCDTPATSRRPGCWPGSA
ncbi:GNAT family protein [Kitasatospora sp. NPDC001603]|uniref:GNAT family N-acetyltransferase n=1 Tax=Kitasatospora sp. NPDC001603 TaxID=3154388 RepID=UPI00331D374A